MNKNIKYAMSVLNIQQRHCEEYEKKHGKNHPLTLEQQAYTKGLKDCIEYCTGYYLIIDRGMFKLVPVE